VVAYVRNTRWPSRRKTSSAKYSLVPHAFWKSSPITLYHGIDQPMRRLTRSICGCRARDEGERGVARVDVGQVADLVGEHRAAAPRLPIGRKPEVVDDQPAAALEEVDQRDGPVRTVEGVIGGELHHRLATALGAQGVAGPGGLLLRQESLVEALPLLVADDWW
jgi:hypothetical protein